MALVTAYEDMILGRARGALGKLGGDDFEGLAGIYQIQRYGNKEVRRKCNFYEYVITNTGPQNAQRAKFAGAVSDWHDLSDEQKKEYNRLAKNRNMSGFNLYIKYKLND